MQRLRIGMHKETRQLVQRLNESHFHIILHFSTNLICFRYSKWLGNEELSFEILGFRNFSITSVIQSKLFRFWIGISLDPWLGTNDWFDLQRFWIGSE
ncbi:hypothetical protein IEQ34_023163 [Dendrobium chrysotoxum]|uniref:Uncharacterized protein n=1 Tax=Dendrobium chrysotoxum TaxID=161865 RepID=A0AAV7FX34_DENCH|nr:hypothetical protein IEQ34_023163 [Dendrobium chrysotoxum]